MKRDAKPMWMLLGGSMLLLAATAILASNESNVLTYRAAAMRHGGYVTHATHTGPTASNDGEMVLVSGTPTIVKPAVDDQFGVRADVPRLWRSVEMFQWREIDYAGSVSYEMDWFKHAVESSGFKHPAGHRNPVRMPFGPGHFLAGEVRLDGFTLSPAIVRAMPGREPVRPDFSTLRPNLAVSFQPLHGTLVTSQDLSSPQLGDVRVSWQGAPLQDVTIIAQNRGGTLKPADDVDDGVGFQLQVGNLQVVDLQPDLPALPLLPWLWRILALLVAGAGAYVLLQGAPARRNGLLPATGLAVTVVCGLAGVMWFSARADIGTVLVGAAVLALGMTSWRLYERLPRD